MKYARCCHSSNSLLLFLKTPPVLLHLLYLNQLQANPELFSSKFTEPRSLTPWQFLALAKPLKLSGWLTNSRCQPPRVKNSRSQMIIISILFWKIKYTWSKFLKAVLFGDVSIFLKKEQFKNVKFIVHVYFPRLVFFFLRYFIMWFGFSPDFYLPWASLISEKCACTLPS